MKGTVISLLLLVSWLKAARRLVVPPLSHVEGRPVYVLIYFGVTFRPAKFI